MFIVSLNYIKDLDAVESYLAEHIEYLKVQYDAGIFMASGRKEPRTGGVILATAHAEEELMDIIKKDPFYINKIAEYEITRFIPSMTDERLTFLKE